MINNHFTVKRIFQGYLNLYIYIYCIHVRCIMLMCMCLNWFHPSEKQQTVRCFYRKHFQFLFCLVLFFVDNNCSRIFYFCHGFINIINTMKKINSKIIRHFPYTYIEKVYILYIQYIIILCHLYIYI